MHVGSIATPFFSAKTEILFHFFQGCFGKGSLSRGCSVLSRAGRNHPQFIKESQWRRHKQWQELASSKKEPESEAKSQEKPKGLLRNNSNCAQKIDDRKSDDKSEEEASSSKQNVTILDDAESESSDIVEVDKSSENSAKRKLDYDSPSQPHKRRNPAAGDCMVQNPAAEEPEVQNPADKQAQVQNPVAEELKVQNPAVGGPKVQNPAAVESKIQSSASERPKILNAPAEKPADQSSIEVVDLSSDEESLCSDQADSG